jgi:competence protein ComEC
MPYSTLNDKEKPMGKSSIYAAVSATCGVAAVSFFSWKWLICLMIYIIVLYFILTSRQLFIQITIIVAFFFTSFNFIHLQKTSFNGDEIHFQITFSESPDIDGNLMKGVVTAQNKENLQFRYIFQTESEKHTWQSSMKIGIACPVVGMLEKPESSRNENSFNYLQYLKQHNIHWIFHAEKIVVDQCKKEKTSLVEKIQYVRDLGIAYINKHFPEPSRGFVAALVFGDQKMIAEDELVAYQQLGIVHLLAISGLHVSFLTGILFYLGIRAGIARERMYMIMLLILPVYTILSGASPSVMRACFMAMFFFIVSLWKKHIAASETIAAVYLILLLYNPNLLYNIGFQLSFAVAFSIIMSLSIVGRFHHQVVQLFVLSVVCQLAAIPILLYHFYEVSILGIILNVLFVPVYSSFFLPFSIITLVVHVLFPPFGELLLFFLNYSFLFCNKMAILAAELPLSTITFGKPAFWMMLVLLLSIVGIFVLWDNLFLQHTKKLTLLACLLLLFQYHIQAFSPYGEVTFIDIGQGDAILIKLPHNRGNYLIDTGGRVEFAQEAWKERRNTYNTAEDTIVPFLKSKSIHHLDMLLLTHPDADHIGSVQELIENITVKKIVIAKGSEGDYQGMEFVQSEAAKGVQFMVVKRGDHWKDGEAEFTVLNPYQKEEDKNEASIVMYAKIGGLSWLFTGDAGEKVENELIQTFPNLKVDVLKVGHHGSKTSTSELFLTSIKPTTAIISAGKDNRYGHPHKQVLDVLHAHHIGVFRTDLQGAVTYRYKNSTGTFFTALP